MLKALTLATLLASAECRIASNHRGLSQQLIAGYEPATTVTDHNALDLDQAKIEELVSTPTEESFALAGRMYAEGSYSKSYAEVTLSEELPFAITDGTKITGETSSRETVAGTALESAEAGATTIKIQYTTSGNQETYVNCQVGGNPTPNLDGCFAASGILVIESSASPLNYTYDPTTDNNNNRTIKGFSTTADPRMRVNQDPSQPFYQDVQKFINYYGTPYYADEFITAALTGSKTNYDRGNADFSQYGFEGRGQGVKKGTAYIAVAMYVIRELEDALDDCNKGCDTDECNDDAVHATDEAVAFYTGSLEGADGSGAGVFMYALAEKRCVNFKTCGPNGDSAEEVNAKINLDIFQQFKTMQANLRSKDCAAARKNKERIAQLMFVPLIQGTLRYAYLTSTTDEYDEEDDAEGAIFAAAVLPVVHACNENDAETIYQNMKTGQRNTADFATVKKAFERNYDCMGITCADVGGYWDPLNSKYYDDASPCGSSSGSDVNLGLAVGLPIGLVVAGILIVVLMRRRRSSEVEFKSDPGTNA